MQLIISVFGKDAQTEARLREQLGRSLVSLPSIKVSGGSDGNELGSVVFVDSRFPRLDERLGSIDRRSRALFLIVNEGDAVPPALEEGRVDDVLVHPFRALEVTSRLRHFRQILLWDEVGRLNSSFTELVEKLRDDLGIAEELQKARLPQRFPDVKGFRVASRYLAGAKAGGDHFDVAEAGDGSALSLVLTDSSSYGLSSAVIAALMRVAVKVAPTEAKSSRDVVRRIHDDLVAALREKDRLSVFYGVVSRRDLGLRYLNLGRSAAFHAPAEGLFVHLPSQGSELAKDKPFEASPDEGRVGLRPDDRLVILSDGFVDAAGGPQAAAALLSRFRKQEPADCLNELVFSVKSRFQREDDLPDQDCTAMVVDVDARALRVAKG